MVQNKTKCDFQLTGDVRVTFNEGASRLFYLWFNTAFVTSGLLQFGKDDLDKKRGKGYGDHFAVEVTPPALVRFPVPFSFLSFFAQKWEPF